MITTGGSMVSDGIKILFGILIKTIMLGIKIITIHTTNNLTTIGLETLIEMATIGKIPPIVQTLITEDERLATLLTEKTTLLIQELQEEEVVQPINKELEKTIRGRNKKSKAPTRRTSITRKNSSTKRSTTPSKDRGTRSSSKRSYSSSRDNNTNSSSRSKLLSFEK